MKFNHWNSPNQMVKEKFSLRLRRIFISTKQFEGVKPYDARPFDPVSVGQMIQQLDLGGVSGKNSDGSTAFGDQTTKFSSDGIGSGKAGLLMGLENVNLQGWNFM